MEYQEFLKTKIKKFECSGFDIDESELNPNLFPFQKFLVKRALKQGKFSLFENCGLGKSIQQLAWAEQVVKYTGMPVIIFCPLAVAAQTILEGEKFGIKVYKYFPNLEDTFTPQINIINYEQIENIPDTSVFGGIVLDESSILKNYTGKYKNLIIEKFKNTRYKLACTATPSPNDHIELGNHSEFLDVMDSGDMLTLFFINNTTDSRGEGLRLKKHGKKHFWQWVASWSVLISSPADIGFDMPGYDLPPLNIIEHQVKTDISNFDNGKLFRESNINATNFNAELRRTRPERMQKTAEIVNSSKEQFIIWINHNEEGSELKKLIPGSIEVRGDDKPEVKEKNLLGFANNEFRVLITKKKIAMFGLNYQNCHNQVFASLDFSFEGLYQAIRRSYRYGQKEQVNIHLITTDTMENVLEAINTKQRSFQEMQNNMINFINSDYTKSWEKDINFIHKIVKAPEWELQLGDSVELIKKVPDGIIDFSLHSPPFSNLYTYSNSYRDMGNTENDLQFQENYKFLINELHRIIRPGRLVAIHTKDLPMYKTVYGVSGLRDFSGDCIKSFRECGFVLHSRITIWTDPVFQMQRTKAQKLLYKQVRQDATFSAQGDPEYLLVFRKWEDIEKNIPVIHRQDQFPLDKWQEYASPVWMTINRMNVLNSREGTEQGDERHLCPLQLDVIERAVELWTNPGELVFDPFNGIGSTSFQSLKMGRRALGFDLKETYFNTAVKNCEGALQGNKQLLLFAA
jgi:DNA modification methylase